MTHTDTPTETHVHTAMQHAELSLTGMDCADCAVKLARSIGSMKGVTEASVDFATAKMHLTYAPDTAGIAEVTERIRKLGYDVAESGKKPTAEAVAVRGSISGYLSQHKRDAFTLAAGVILAIGFILSILGAPLTLVRAVFAVSIALGGYFVARKGLASLFISHQLDINLLMIIAVIGAAAIGEWEEGALVVFLFGLGETLESYTVERSRRAIRSLMAIAPAEATVITSCQNCEEHIGLAMNGGGVYQGGPCPWCQHETRLPVEQLTIGNHILVRPGERIPMDGWILAGSSAVNQAPITGESLPIEKGVADSVFAGTMNGEGALEIEVTHLAKDNTLSRIIQMVERGQAQKAPTQRFVDIFARYYTPIVVILAVLTAAVPPLFFGQPFLDQPGMPHGWLYRALSLLIIACPCALVISTPVSIVSAIANAAKNGVLIKGGAYLEATGALKALAFDKTGTLTKGQPTVTDIAPMHGYSEDQLLSLAATIESRSEHPLAQAIVTAARARSLMFEPGADFRALTGLGATVSLANGPAYAGNAALFQNVGTALPTDMQTQIEQLEATGKTAMAIYGPANGHNGSDQSGFVGIIAVADTLRPEARPALEALRRAGISRSIMLTGDNERTAAAIAASAGVEEMRANLLPQDKLETIETLLRQYGSVGMVGDGVNDAPALARATVGIAMGGAGSDQALETADIVLMGDDLAKLPFAVRLSRRALAIIRQNVVLSIAIKLIFLALALPGLATLWMAVFADMGASLIVTLNGMRLYRYKE